MPFYNAKQDLTSWWVSRELHIFQNLYLTNVQYGEGTWFLKTHAKSRHFRRLPARRARSPYSLRKFRFLVFRSLCVKRRNSLKVELLAMTWFNKEGQAKAHYSDTGFK